MKTKQKVRSSQLNPYLLTCTLILLFIGIMIALSNGFSTREVGTVEVQSPIKELALTRLNKDKTELPSLSVKQETVIEEEICMIAPVEIIEEVILEEEEEEVEEKEEEIEERVIVYDNMTMDELATKLNRSLDSTISGKGYLFASYSIKLGIDPYLAVAIVLQETGCKWNCSYLVTHCNNVGGQKGGPNCSGGYKGYNSLDEGIMGFMDNLYNNYYAYGLKDVYSIHKKYAEDPNWPTYVNNYIAAIKAN